MSTTCKPLLVLRHVEHVSAGSLTAAMARAGIEARQFDLHRRVPNRLPFEECSGLVVLGGPMSANDEAEFPYLCGELEWIREAVDRQVPLLGICLGAQLLAKALGGRVYRNPVKEIGWFEVELLPAAADDRLFTGRTARETVFQWHGDTFDLPPGAVHLAQTGTCRHQAFRVGPLTYGLQFHVEMTPELLEEWLSGPKALDDSEEAVRVDRAAIRRLAPQHFPALDSFSRTLLDRFLAIVRASAGV